MKTVIEIYRDRAGEGQWRWRMKRGWRIVADSGEGYKGKAALLRTLNRLIGSFANGQYKYEEYEWRD